MSRFDQYLSGNETPKDLCTEIDKLEEQIEKMKCCGNCKHYDYCPMSSNIECNSTNNSLEYKWELVE